MDTIYALATPPGKSGVAVIRLSGPDALTIGQKLTGAEFTPRHAHFLPLKNQSGEILDEAVVLAFKGPASFTGEDIIEFQIHGSRAAILAVTAELENLGAKLASPGEFTRRALENGKLDMIQVEALADFINSDTEIQRKQSLSGYLGRDSEWVNNIRTDLLQSMSLVTLALDFSDEELPTDLIAQVQASVQALVDELNLEIHRSTRSASLRDGFHVAIIGKPNVGKSSLLNAIAGREVAITTEIPGTTRDVLEVFVDLKGLPIIFLDTAGIRETEDHVENLGVGKALQAAQDADLRIFLYQEKSELDDFAEFIEAEDFIYQSKADLHSGSEISISSKTGLGIDKMLERVRIYFESITRDLGRFQHQRQINALVEARDALVDAYSASLLGEVEFDIVAEHLRRGVFALDHLVGRVDIEDMLDVIFSQFCIGK